MSAGKKILKEDVVSALIVLVPLGLFGLMRMLRELKRVRLARNNMNPLGVYLAPSFILWHLSGSRSHIVDKADIKSQNQRLMSGRLGIHNS